MTIKNLTTILLRVVALYFLYDSIINLIGIYASANHIDLNHWQSLRVIIPLCAFMALWIFPNTIANLIVTPINNNNVSAITGLDWLRVFVITLGLYLTVKAALDCVYFLTTILFDTGQVSVKYSTEFKSGMLTSLLELVIGLIFINKNSWISQKLYSVNQPE